MARTESKTSDTPGKHTTDSVGVTDGATVNKGEDRITTPIPAPSEAQLAAGAPADPNAHLGEAQYEMPPITEDQVNTAVDFNAPHTDVVKASLPADEKPARGDAVNDTRTATEVDPANPSSTKAANA